MKKISLPCHVLFLFSFNILFALPKQTICLNMIIKNESHVIERCLKSLKNYIDYWVIVDTGSSDGTQDLVKNFLKDIPGELHQSEWVNFEHNRNEALQFAKNKGDYLLFIDADEQFAFPEGFNWPNFDKDYYFFVTNFNGVKYNRIQLINNHLNWRWKGVLHEYLESLDAKSFGELKEVVNIVSPDGARSKDPDKFKKDAQILEKALEKEPNNTRYVFYLAQSYKDAGQFEKAIEIFKKRMTMGGGFSQEIFWSQYQIGILQQALNMTPEVFLKSYYDAFTIFPFRAEPLNRIVTYYRFAKEYKKGYDLAKLASAIPHPDYYSIFVEDWVYSYNLLLEWSIDAYWIGNYEESKKICLQLLEKKDLPQNVRECVETNLMWANSMIYKDLLNSLNELMASHYKDLLKSEQTKSEQARSAIASDQSRPEQTKNEKEIALPQTVK